jgi:hypothetical protein
MKKWLVPAVAGFSVFIIGCGVSSKPSNEDTKRLNDNTQGTADATLPPAKPTGVIGSGDWKVGTKANFSANTIVPGTYTITGITDGYGCYWEVVKNFTGEGDYIITNGNIEPGHNGTVVIKKTAGGLRLDSGCIAKKAS